MILEKNQDLNLKILECLVPALINIKMQSLNMALKCSQAMDSVLELRLEMEIMSPVLETINLKNRFSLILVELLEKILGILLS